ncbi:MAG: hypothetical protein ABIS28_11150, partial [Caldimonas sp.]
MAVARHCSDRVVTADEVQCCGFAGERGFIRPELNEHALRHLKAALPADCVIGYSSSRTCEIGLSEQAGFPYQSILYLVERLSSAPMPAPRRQDTAAARLETATPPGAEVDLIASATSSAMSRD